MTTTYYAYLKDRVGAAGPLGRGQLEQLVEAERNALWQMMAANPAYDERTRLNALAAFDEAAGRVLAEESRRSANGPPGGRSLDAPQRTRPDDRGAGFPVRSRSLGRDVLMLLIGAALGFAAAYFGRGLVERALEGVGASAERRVPRLVASESSFKFGRTTSAERAGEIRVDYGAGARDPSRCEVEATYRQLLEYVRFDPNCRTVSFKFLPLEELHKNFNYLQGYMVFTTTIVSAGSAWKGTASVYFSIDASA